MRIDGSYAVMAATGAAATNELYTGMLAIS